METALVLSRYAGWCGGTAAKAASYPINTMVDKKNGNPRRASLAGRQGFIKSRKCGKMKFAVHPVRFSALFCFPQTLKRLVEFFL